MMILRVLALTVAVVTASSVTGHYTAQKAPAVCDCACGCDLCAGGDCDVCPDCVDCCSAATKTGCGYECAAATGCDACATGACADCPDCENCCAASKASTACPHCVK
ncbi:MAG: hypothetical protein ACJ8F7_02585 [Gemmataceae bacterium]